LSRRSRCFGRSSISGSFPIATLEELPSSLVAIYAPRWNPRASRRSKYMEKFTSVVKLEPNTDRSQRKNLNKRVITVVIF
jgi:hypothetical protein